ncbi:MAG: hypothetical protein HY683_08685, partial [Chloroflexi bacterium]|nr:hypothetical protein [Chloroflexota bacterium]
MTLRGLFPLLEGHPAYRAMHDPLDKGGSAQLALLDPVRPYLLAALWDALGVPVLLLTPGPETARRLADELALFAGEAAPVLHLPETEALPFERLAPDEATVQARLRALAALARAWDAQPFRGRAQQDGSLPPCVVASLPAALQRTPRREAVSAACHTVRKGERHSMEGLLRRWLALGYRVERTADASGTVARRGGILDVFPAGADLPARLEFLGDVVESIRSFDPASQRSIEDVDAVEVLPAREVLPALGDRVRAEALLAALSPDGCRPSEMDRVRDDLSRIFAGEEVAEAGFYAGFLNQGSLLDYLPPHGLLVLDDPRKLTQAGEELDEEIARLRGQKEARGDLPRGFPSPRWPWGEIRPRLEATQHRLLLAPWVQTPGEQAPGLEAASPPVFLGKAESLADWLRRLRDGRTLVITRHDRRLAGVLREHELGARVETAVEATPSSASITLVRGYLSEGFILPLPDGPLAVLTDAEVFGTAKVPGRPGRGRAAAPRREVALAELTPGTYVVHVEHGIARFVGIKKAAGDGGEREFLVLQYAEGDKLYVPMEQLDRVSPYFAPSGEPPVLTRLGTQEWARAKQRAKESAQQMAGELLKLYAARSVLEGHP